MKNLMEKFMKKQQFNWTSKIDKISSKTINDILRPINILCIIFGTRIFEIPSGQSRPIISWFYSMLCLGLSYGIWLYRKSSIKYTTVSYFDETVDYVLNTMNYIVLFVIAMMGLYKTESWKLCAKKIHQIDKTLEALGSSSCFDKFYKKIIMEIIFFVSYTLFGFVMLFLAKISIDQMFHIVCLTLIQYLYIMMAKFLLIIDFCTMIRCVESEFQRANRLLSDVNILPISSIASKLILRSFSDDSKKLFKNSSLLNGTHSRLQVANHKLNRSRKLLRTIRQVHLELYKLSKSCSKIYGMQMSLEMAIGILCNTQLLYSFYAQYMNQTLYDNGSFYRWSFAILVSLQYTISILAVNYICDRTTKEADRTNEIIHTFYGKNTDFVIQKEVEIFSMQMMQCRTTYSAFGLYNFSCKQICSCIGIITTYVVIMVQVADSLEKGF